MKLEFLGNLSRGGANKEVVSENLVRLYDFDEGETGELVHLIEESLLGEGREIDLATVPFVEMLNCSLLLRLSKTDLGVCKTAVPGAFVCSLSGDTWLDAIETMQYTEQGFNWLCETSVDNIDFLYSPDGTW